MAASNSITNDAGVPIRLGAISDTNAAIPRLIGTAIAIAIEAQANVPIIYGRAPKDSRPSTGFQSVPIKNCKPSEDNIGIDPSAIE